MPDIHINEPGLTIALGYMANVVIDGKVWKTDWPHVWEIPHVLGKDCLLTLWENRFAQCSCGWSIDSLASPPPTPPIAEIIGPTPSSAR